MSTFRQSLALSVGTILAVACVWACTATRSRDGSMTISFAPDMAITAWGLEDALSKLTDLFDRCITGNYDRPCTQNEMDEIRETIVNVLDVKDRLYHPSQPNSGGSVPC